METHGAPLEDIDGTIAQLAVSRDVTERKGIEERLRKTEKIAAAGQLAASLAHEINNPLSSVINALYLLKHDSALGTFEPPVSADGDSIQVGDRTVRFLSERDPAGLRWKELGVDIVVESTGLFTDAGKARVHIDSGGARKVIISAPATNQDHTFVMGVNQDQYDPAAQLDHVGTRIHN